MKTNDLKKGDRVQLRNGWFATIADNTKGNTRLADVEGFCREIGSVYSHDIVSLHTACNDDWHDGECSGHTTMIEHTPAQLKLKADLERMGF